MGIETIINSKHRLHRKMKIKSYDREERKKEHNFMLRPRRKSFKLRH